MCACGWGLKHLTDLGLAFFLFVECYEFKEDFQTVEADIFVVVLS